MEDRRGYHRRWEDQEEQSSQLDLPELLKKSGSDPFTVQEAGSLEEGFREADQVLEATYYIPYVATVPMEPRAAVARWEGDKLTVWAGSQRPFGLRTELAGRFEIDESDVRVITFFDYRCPYCRTLTKILSRMQSDNNFQIIFKEWPILSESSVLAARAALAADKQDHYGAFHKRLM